MVVSQHCPQYRADRWAPSHAMREERVQWIPNGDERAEIASEETGEVSGRRATNNRCAFVRRNAGSSGCVSPRYPRVSGKGFAPTRNPTPLSHSRGQCVLEHRPCPTTLGAARDAPRPPGCPSSASFAAKMVMVGSQVPDTSQTIRWPDTALPLIGMVHNESTILSPAGS